MTENWPALMGELRAAYGGANVSVQCVRGVWRIETRSPHRFAAASAPSLAQAFAVLFADAPRTEVGA